MFQGLTRARESLKCSQRPAVGRDQRPRPHDPFERRLLLLGPQVPPAGGQVVPRAPLRRVRPSLLQRSAGLLARSKDLTVEAETRLGYVPLASFADGSAIVRQKSEKKPRQDPDGRRPA